MPIATKWGIFSTLTWGIDRAFNTGTMAKPHNRYPIMILITYLPVKFFMRN